MKHVYILKSEKDSALYIGSTSDMRRRYEEHCRGKVRSTKCRRPLKLLYMETYSAASAAEDRERKLKKFGSAYTALMKRLGEK